MKATATPSNSNTFEALNNMSMMSKTNINKETSINPNAAITNNKDNTNNTTNNNTSKPRGGFGFIKKGGNTAKSPITSEPSGGEQSLSQSMSKYQVNTGLNTLNNETKNINVKQKKN